MTDKRIRSLNFTNDEKLNCLGIIKNYQHIIENKKNGTVSWKYKENAWKLIEREFKAQSTVYRSVDVLKRFYNNTKKDTRKRAALEKVSFNKTGGGQAEVMKSTNDPIFNLTMDIINKKTVFGLHNNWDGDAKKHLDDAESFMLPRELNEQAVEENPRGRNCGANTGRRRRK